MLPLMNDTKWDEIRLAMYALDPSPRWRTRDVETGHESEWDREWYHHFRVGGYETIEWVQIEARDDAHLAEIVTALREIHVPGMISDGVVKVFGYIEPGAPVEWV